MTPSQLKNLTPADVEALKRLATLRAAQAARPALPGTPGFIGPPQPPAAPQGTVSRLAGNVVNAGRTAAGVVGRGLGRLGTAGIIAGGALEGARQVEGLRDLRRGDLSPGEWVQDYYAPSVAGPLAGSIPTPDALQRTKEAYEKDGIGGMLLNVGKEAVAPIYNAGRAVGNFLFGKEDFSDSAVGVGEDAGTITSAAEQERLDNTKPITLDSNISRFTRNIGDQQLRSYTTPQGFLAGMVPAGRGSGGFVGAATDAEAAQNLQARFAQDAAARGIAANTDQAIERMRDFRADRMGISRGRLDASEGRGGGGGEAIRGVTQNPFAMPGDSFGDDVMRKNKLMSAIENPEGKTLRQRTANQEAALGTFKAFMEGGQQPTQTTPGVNPLDAGRFLLDQEKFARQQGLDKARLGIEQGTLEDRRAGTALEQQKYNDEQRAAFVENFSFPDENAPREQIAADVFNMSQATGGLVPPEVVSAYYVKVAKELGIDWGKGGPKNPMDLNQEVMKAIARDYGGK